MKKLNINNITKLSITMLLRNFLIIQVLLYGICCGAYAQDTTAGTGSKLTGDFRQVAMNMKKQHENVEKFHIVMSINVFDGSSVPYYQTKAEVRKGKENYHYAYGGHDMLMNEKYLIMVDHEEREIVCSRRNRKSESIFVDPVQMSIDSILSLLGKPEYIGKSGDEEHFRILQTNNLVTQIDLYIDTRFNLLKRIAYQYQDKQVATIKFETFDIHPEFKPETFDEGQYVVEVNGKFKTAPKYQHYNIVGSEEEEQ